MTRSAGRAGQACLQRFSPGQPHLDLHLAGQQPIAALSGLHLDPRGEPLRGDAACDLAVIGGGFSGLWTALLAKEANPGRSVMLIEGNRIGWAASGRNGGFCDASLTHGADNGRERFPAEFGTLQRLGLENLDAIEATIGRHGIDCDFERAGTITVATEDYQVAELYAAAPDTPTILRDGEWAPPSSLSPAPSASSA